MGIARLIWSLAWVWEELYDMPQSIMTLSRLTDTMYLTFCHFGGFSGAELQYIQQK